MKNIFKVFRKDIKNIIKNPIALIIIIGVCVLPSLYAWVNIKACWNPYENTGTIPVAVVNNDKGSSIYGKDVNVGDSVVDELKQNKAIGWKFVNIKNANMGIVDGTYYAIIEIPENFSTDLVSLVSDNPKKPEITYKVNTKANPVSGKITEAAEGKLVDQITSNFVQTINEVVFKSLNGVGSDLKDNKDEIIKLKKSIIAVNKNMDFITNSLSYLETNATNFSSYLKDIQATIPSMTAGLDGIQNATETTNNLIGATEGSLNKSFDNLRFNLDSINSASKRIKTLLEGLKKGDPTTTNTVISQINNEIDLINTSIDSVVKFLDSINKDNSNADIANMMSALKKIQVVLGNEKTNLSKLQQSVSDGIITNKELLQTMISNTENMTSEIGSILSSYDSTTRPALNNISNNLKSATKEAAALLETSKGLVDQINTLMSNASEGSDLTAKSAKELSGKLLEFKDVIKGLSEKLQDVSDENLSQILAVLQSKPSLMGNFIADPFNIKEEPIYSVPNYGSGMAPIYSVLALWVGGLILTSLLKTDVRNPADFPDLTIRERHFGKMLTFVFLAVVQGFIVSFGDKVVLGVYTVNAPLMIAFAMYASMTFTIITFTLVSLFGNIGKAMSIILMVIQIAGCGGTYPIQVDPKFFRILQPLFPFTYAVGGFREAIAGPLMSSVALDFFALTVISLIFILIGFFFKEPLHGKVQKFEAKFKESGMPE